MVLIYSCLEEIFENSRKVPFACRICWFLGGCGGRVSVLKLGTSVFVQGTTGDAADGKEMKFAEAPGTGRITQRKCSITIPAQGPSPAEHLPLGWDCKQCRDLSGPSSVFKVRSRLSAFLEQRLRD